VDDHQTAGPDGMQPEPEARPGAKMSDYLGMGTLIGLGAALGLLFGTMLGSVIWGMLAGAAAGTVIGAIVEAQRAK